jgi:hypothetical protein
MCAWNRLLLYTSLAAPIALSGCSKEVKAEFPRPSAPVVTPTIEEEPPGLLDAESSSVEPVVADEVEPEPVWEIPTPKAAVELPAPRPRENARHR